VKATLFVIAILLGVIFLPIGLLYSMLYRVVFTTRSNAKASDYFHTCALAIDQLGNVFCSDLFNSTLIYVTATHPFGDADQTISAVLGYAQEEKTLTTLGHALANLLDAIDPNHCNKAMIADIEQCQQLKTQS